MTTTWQTIGCTALVLALGAFSARADDGVELFRNRIAPLLRERCLDCHGGRRTKAGIDVRLRESFVQGNRHGPVIVPRDPAGSRLVAMVERIRTPEMPPRHPLSAGEIHDLVRWIELGAPFDGPLVSASARP